MESNTAAFVKEQNQKAVFGNVPCDLSNVTGTIHLIGIGGIGMSALARLLLAGGWTVSGSDKQASEITNELSALGATIYTRHAANNIDKATAIVISTAIVKENAELNAALEKELPVWHRSQVLAALAAGKEAIAISGTHGKTTTTGMIAQVFIDCNQDPSVVVGGIFARMGTNARAGKGKFFIAEADESDGTHTSFKSQIAVVTNIEADHLENYTGGISQIYEAMTSFCNVAQNAIVLCLDDPGCQRILPDLKREVIGYGRMNKDSSATFQYEDLGGFSLRVYKNKKALGDLKLSVPGDHNKLNALATIAVAEKLGLDFKDICASLSQFRGVDRRFQPIGQAKNILVIDDYAHHPTEVIATLQAAKTFIEEGKNVGEPTRRLVAIFQPHQPRRLQDFWNDFCKSFKVADLVLLTDVYIARGAAIPEINSEKLAQAVEHKNCHYIAGPTKDLAQLILPHLKENDLVLTIGAGDITTVAPQLVKLLQQT